MNATTLSLRLPVNPSMTEDDFLSIIKLWIDGSPYYEKLAGLLKDGIKTNTKETISGTTIEVITKKTTEDRWIAVKHNNHYLEQEWETYVMFHGTEEKEVLIHISCLGDISHTTSFPYQRLEIIRTFAKAGEMVLHENVFSGTNYKIASEEDKDFLIRVMNGEIIPVLPVVYVTKFFGSCGYAVDLDTLAKRLEGIAYVICEPDEAYSDYIRNRVYDGRHNLPKNGAVGVYFGGNKIIYPRNGFSAVDGYVMQYVLQAVTSHTNKNYTTPAKFNRDIIAEHEALIDEYSVENMSLEEKLKEAEEKVAQLTVKNKILTETNESLKTTLAATGGQGMVNKSDLEEFFEGEQHDAVLKALEMALKSMGTDTRLYEIVRSVLDCNKPQYHGIVIYDEVKKLFSAGMNLNKADMAKLEDLGFDVVGENVHKKLVFKGNEKYMFPLASTGSDSKRGGLNFASDVVRKLTVY